MRHASQIGGGDASVDVFAHADGELGFGAQEFRRLDVFAQPDDFAFAVRHLDADRALARHAFDQDTFGAQGEAEIVGESDDAAVLDAGFRLELEGGDHRAGVDLRDLAEDLEFRVFRGQNLSDEFEFLFVDGLLLVGTVQQARRRKLVTARDFREDRFRLVLVISALGDFYIGCGSGVGRVFVGQHALDAGARGRSGGLHAGDFLTRTVGTRCYRTRGHELRGDGWFFGAALFQFFLLTLARSLVAPVFEPISERQDEGEAGRRPDFNRRK